MHDEKLYDFISSPDIIIMMKSRRMRWAGLVIYMGKEQNAYRI